MIKEARSLNDKKFRRNLGKFLVDGEKLVNDLVCGAGEIDKIFVDCTKLSQFGYILSNFDGKVVPVTSKVMASISENNTPQGIIAEVFMNPTGEFNPEKNEPFLILDRIQDPGNLGTIIRSAVAFNIDTIILSKLIFLLNKLKGMLFLVFYTFLHQYIFYTYQVHKVG